MENIKKLDTETPSIYEKRLEIIEKINFEIDNLEEAIKLSNIWYNVKYNKCYYDVSLFNKIKSYL